MNIADAVLAAIIGFILVVSLLNPGGLYVAAFIAAVLIGIRLFAPFARDYFISINKGKAGQAHRARVHADESRKGGQD